MAQYFQIHPTHPQPRLIKRAAEIVRAGGVIAYPTDSSYALGCHIGDKAAMERIRRIRRPEPRARRTRAPPSVRARLAEPGAPLRSPALILPGEALPLSDPAAIRD